MKTTCRICGRVDLPEAICRELCVHCLKAFDEGYVAGHREGFEVGGGGYEYGRNDAEAIPTRCGHGTIRDLCEICAREERAFKAKRRAEQAELPARVRAVRQHCLACDTNRENPSRWQLCPTCEALYLEALAERMAANPPPVAQLFPQPSVVLPIAPVAQGEGPGARMPRGPVPLTPCCMAALRFVPAWSAVTGEEGVVLVCAACGHEVDFHKLLTGGRR